MNLLAKIKLLLKVNVHRTEILYYTHTLKKTSFSLTFEFLLYIKVALVEEMYDTTVEFRYFSLEEDFSVIKKERCMYNMEFWKGIYTFK